MTGTPSAPPTMPDPNAVARRKPVWPTVVGVLSVIFGGGGLLVGVVGIIFVIFFQDMITPAGVPQNERVALTVLSQVIYVALAGLLLAGGVLLLMRRRAAVRLLVVWSVGKIIYGLLAAALQAVVQAETFATINQQGQGAGASLSWAVIVWTVLWTLIWTSAFPVFLLIWLRRPTVKLDVAEFDAGPARDPYATGSAGP